MTVQTRSNYGAPLPWSVVDENFTSLQAGVDAAAVATDLSSNSVGKGAATIGISPIAGVSATSVQAAIAELANDNNALAGSGGAALIGANDSASGSIFTTVAGFISRVMSSTGASVVGFIQSGTGAVFRWLQEKSRETISVEDFGAVSGLSADPAVNDLAFARALAEAKARGAAKVYALAQYYVLSARLSIPDGVTLVGSGVGLWDCVYHSRAKSWRGTNLIFKGTGSRDLQFYGITGMVDAGGVRTVSGLVCKLTSFMNSDSSASATRATRRAFSAAVGPETINGGSHWGLKDLRIVPWMGADGVADYSNTSNTSLGNDWDVGVLVQDSEYVSLKNVQVVGYWRIAGLLEANPGLDAYGYGERNRYTDCKFQGYAGAVIRASDRWKVSATTTSSITIKHNSQHYWPSSGSFESTQTGNVHTYTGLTYGAGNLVFTGVSPDPTGTTQIRNPKRGSGVAGTRFTDCMIHGLDHVSGSKATALGFADPSKALEVSGFPVRGLQFYNSKAQTREDVVAFFHDCTDTYAFGLQFEGDGRVIASPFENSSTATAPSGATSTLRMMSSLISSCDVSGFTPRTVYDDLGAVNTLWTPSFDFVTVTSYATQKGKYLKLGNCVFFTIELDWTGLDTTDTSSIQIRLPVGNSVTHINATINDKDSTGISFSSVVNPAPAPISSVYLAFADATSYLAYNSGKISASGKLIMSGQYWIES